MSADNYYLIRKMAVGFVVTDESASAEEPSPIYNQRGEVRGLRFAKLQDAWDYAKKLEAEYPVSVDFPIETIVREVFGE